MAENLTLSALFFGMILVLSACSNTVEEIPPVQIRTVEVPRPAPIVPDADRLSLRDVEWTIVTPDNIDAIFEEMGEEAVLFAITADGYEALALNLSDLRALIQQQNEIIAVYRQSYE